MSQKKGCTVINERLLSRDAWTPWSAKNGLLNTHILHWRRSERSFELHAFIICGVLTTYSALYKKQCRCCAYPTDLTAEWELHRACYNIDVLGGNPLLSYLYKYPEQLSSEEGMALPREQRTEIAQQDCQRGGVLCWSCTGRNDKFLAGSTISYLYAVFICAFPIPAPTITAWI